MKTLEQTANEGVGSDGERNEYELTANSAHEWADRHDAHPG